MPAVSSWSEPGTAAHLVALRRSVGKADVIAVSGALTADAVDAVADAPDAGQ